MHLNGLIVVIPVAAIGNFGAGGDYSMEFVIRHILDQSLGIR